MEETSPPHNKLEIVAEPMEIALLSIENFEEVMMIRIKSIQEKRKKLEEILGIRSNEIVSNENATYYN